MSLRSISHTQVLLMGVCIFLCLIAYKGRAQTELLHELSIHSDNDAYLFINQDQYYTNGISFSYRQLVDKDFSAASAKKKIWGIAIGHKLYNAYNGFSELVLMDRPFTAYLYGRVNKAWFYRDESSLNLGAEVGLYGKGAFGEALQEGFHNLFGFYEISGWEYQLRDHVTLDLRAKYSRLLLRSTSGKMDLQLQSSMSLGLNQSFIGAGPVLRLGKLNALYASAYNGSRLFQKGEVVNKERYFYYRPMLFYRLYDASIQGGMLLDDKGPVTFGIKPWMLSQIVGFTYAHRHVTIDAHLQFNTKEVKSNATAHQFGSISIGYAF
ncbi:MULTISPECIES: lipid A deacylase LpxR family protein [Olivibacter]|uniref:Lipid A deacylase LpxR family protein n=1 Tax=Olivibacter oleidegradans TaxID=760123 RepID=A0ABV6HLN3_9SPHI|nr:MULTISPECIES: lipid A deacylase LpxR family protein [Olivibacter]MDM8176020.1 lipid A deacylase LpxR family protein [Olivibacter sp. 47]QEL02594.1 lipid A deacylase LpxR family protein [Olivibacter sp. LS-1]